MYQTNTEFMPKTVTSSSGYLVPSYIDHEEPCMNYWDNINIYKKMLEKNTNCPKFVFMDGPPFVSGDLHHGHLAVSFAKSVMFNYKIMKGFNCKVKLGYDCHGLPAINKTMADNNLTHEQVKEMGIAGFNHLCNEMITKYSSSWSPLFKRIGRIANFDDTYMTRDTNFMESVFWIFKQLWNKNLVYKGNKVMAYSYANRTPLSNFEASQNYKEKTSKSIYVSFEIVEQPNTYFVIWTTTPWTLPSNIAICVNEKIEYQKIKVNDKYFIVGKNCIKNVFDKKIQYEIIDTFAGSSLVGMKYKPVYQYFIGQNNHVVLSDPYVTEGDMGTAIVHMAPAFGDDDYRVCEANGLVNNVSIGDFCPIDENGCFTERIVEYNGRLVFDTEDDIIVQMKNNGHLIKKQLYKHNYPYCWRSETPLIYRTTPSYYINVSVLKTRMIELNKTVNWYPKNVGEGRFHQWLSSIKDWAVSRNTSYATPIPIWRSNDGDEICIGSIAELQQYTDTTINNLHPEYINDIVIEKNGKKYHRVTDTFDCWFESGSVPMAQLHYPFNPDSLYLNDLEYLSDFICEGLDQTRGWFYTLLVLSTAIFDKAPYRNVMCTGLILDKNGDKFSKKNGNFVDPRTTIKEFGSDMFRIYFVRSPVMSAECLMFNEEIMRDIRMFIVPYINGVTFWLEHTQNFMKKFNIDSFQQVYDKVSDHPFDKWIIAKVHILTNKVNEYMDNYDFSNAVDAMIRFVHIITNIYIKFNRDRFKKMDDFNECTNSLSTLCHVLLTFCRLMTPITPFLCEHIYQYMHFCSDEFKNIESILLTDYPSIHNTIDSTCIVDDLLRICDNIRTIRQKTPKHVQAIIPFKNIIVCHSDIDYLTMLKNNYYLIKNELNCLNIEFNVMRDENISFSMKVNNSIIGCEFKKNAKIVVSYLNELTNEQLRAISKNKFVPTIKVGNDELIIEPKFYEVIKVPIGNQNNANIINHLDTDLLFCVDSSYDDIVHNTVQAKKLHSKIQNIRKIIGLHPWDRINIFLKFDNIAESIVQHIKNSLKVPIFVVDKFDNMNNNVQHIESFTIEYINDKNVGDICVHCVDKFIA